MSGPLQRLTREHYEAHRELYIQRAAEARTWYRWHLLAGNSAGANYYLAELLEALFRLVTARRLYYARATAT